MNMTALILTFAGFVLLYGAIKNKSPLEVIKNAITGKPPSSASPIGTGGTGGTTGTN